MKAKVFAILAALMTFSCLDVELDPPVGDTPSAVFQSIDDYKSYLGKVYGSLTLTGQAGPAGQPDIGSEIITDEGFSSYLRVWWKAQELTTEEAVIAWSDAGIRDLHNHEWSSSNQFVLVLYYRIFYTISLANDFLGTANNPPNALTRAELEELDGYIAEARFLRAYAYWQALDAFRNVALLTSITGDIPKQASPQDVFDFIESELEDMESNLLDPNQDPGSYGRPTKAAAWMLKARLYLNAEVYIGQSKYAEAIGECNKVIAGGVHSIASVYDELFMGDNHLRSDEIIWPIVHDGLVSQTWGGTTTIIRGGIGGTMEAEDSGVPSGWAGWRTTSALVEKFPGASTNDGVSADSRAIFWADGQNLAINDVAQFTDGWASPKFTNIEASTGVRAAGVDFVSTDFPVFRLADAYLMLAESELRTGGGVSAATLGHLNKLRQRAYGNNTGDVTIAEVDLDFILDERARELYLEAIRRTDLIRHEKFSGGGYLWPWKGGVDIGTMTSSHLDIFPIPASELIANPAMIQNDGY